MNMQATTEELAQRKKVLLEAMTEHGWDVICLSDRTNQDFLIDTIEPDGHPAFLLLDRSGEYVLIAGEGDGLTGWQRDDVTVRTYPVYDAERWTVPADNAARLLTEALQSSRARRLGTDMLPVRSACGNVVSLVGEGLMLYDVRPILSRMRRTKRPYEIERIREAGRLHEAMYRAVRRQITDAKDEFELFHLMSLEAWRFAGRPISLDGQYDLLSGPRTMQAGGKPVNRKLCAGDLVLVDLFPRFGGYYADTCRTICTSAGQPNPLQERMFDRVTRALRIAESGLKPGVRVKELFDEVNAELAKIGGGYSLPHHLGHGIGLQDQEGPYLVREGEDVLEEGMVICIEPGIYLEGAGVRIENMYVVRADGPENLTPFDEGW